MRRARREGWAEELDVDVEDVRRRVRSRREMRARERTKEVVRRGV